MEAIPYTPRDFIHYWRLFRRNQRRQKIWGKRFERALSSGTYRLPGPAVVQLIPTEKCNLRCPMCNQWGENGYFFEGIRPVQHMPQEGLVRLVRGIDPGDTMISVHGGEPFVYKHFETLLEVLAERQFDVMFSTNGTLIDRYIEPLSRLENLSFLLSIDGDEKTHDKIRGKGRFRQAQRGIGMLFEACRRRGRPLPGVILNFTVCEWNPGVIERVHDVACELGVFAVNYNMRWFLTKEIGQAYEKVLKRDLGVKSSGAWRGWISNHSSDFAAEAGHQLRRVLRTHRFRLRPPYVITTPRKLKGDDFEEYFGNYENVFGNESCFMPFYWARIHATGELIFCPGHPDVIAGNVFDEGGLEGAFNSEMSIRFRRHMLTNRLPICNRCCGLYMTYPGRPEEQRVRRRLGLPRVKGAEVGSS